MQNHDFINIALCCFLKKSPFILLECTNCYRKQAKMLTVIQVPSWLAGTNMNGCIWQVQTFRSLYETFTKILYQEATVNIRNLDKTPISKSLPGVLEDMEVPGHWRWYVSTHKKLLCKFHLNLLLSSKSLSGDLEVPDKPADGVLKDPSWSLKGHGSSWWTWRWFHMTCINPMKLLWKFIQIQHQEPCQDSTSPPSPFQESWRTRRFLTNLEMVSYDMY